MHDYASVIKMAESRSPFASTDDPSNAATGESGGAGAVRGVQTSPGRELMILVANIRGLRQGCGELGVMAAEHDNPHFLCLTETHLDAEPNNYTTPSGYVVKARADRTKHGGGVIIMAREDVLCDTYPVEKYYVQGKAEMCAVTIPGGSPTTLVCVYTQPSATDTTLIKQLELLYEDITKDKKQQALMVGDFNAHEENWLNSAKTDAAGKATRQFCESRGLLQLVSKPTRGEATLDLVVGPYEGSVTHLPHCGSSDHQTLLVTLARILETPSVAPKRTVYHWKRAAWNQMVGEFRSTNWDLPDNVEAAVESITSKITAVTNKFVPRSSPTMARPFPWWDRRCQKIWTKKETAWRIGDMVVYAALRKKARRVYGKAFGKHQERIKEKLAKGTNPKSWWQMTRDIAGLGRKKQSVTPEAQALATFFTEKFHIPNEESAELPNLEDDDFEFELKTFRVKRNRVQRVLERLDECKSVGLDGVSPRVLKRCAAALSLPITRLFQKIVRSGVFPEAWKVARVTPIHKKGPTSSPSNYRPISVLPTLSTTFERVLLPQLRKRLLQYIPDEQFGFVPNTGTADVGVVIADEAATALEAREELRVVALDLKGAFDRVWWRGLLAHFWAVGIRGKAYKLLNSYLSQRFFVVVTNGEKSELCQIRSGVPQGGIWSPLLFDLFVRKLPREVQHAVMLCYADDTTILMRVPTGGRKTCATMLNSDLERILNFGKKWLLEFEAKKTKAITISRKRDPDENPPLVMDGTTIAENETLEVLGFTIDSKGTWSAHVDRTVKEARQRLGAIRRVRGYLNDNGVCTAYKAFVRPKLEYGSLTYWSTAKTHLAKLDLVQQQAQGLFEGLAIKSLEQRREAAAVGLACRLLSGDVKRPLESLIPKCRDPSEGRLRRSARLGGHKQQHQHQLQCQTTAKSLEVFKRSFRGRIHDIWNGLESECLQSPSPDWKTCRRELQRDLISRTNVHMYS